MAKENIEVLPQTLNQLKHIGAYYLNSFVLLSMLHTVASGNYLKHSQLFAHHISLLFEVY